MKQKTTDTSKTTTATTAAKRTVDRRHHDVDDERFGDNKMAMGRWRSRRKREVERDLCVCSVCALDSTPRLTNVEIFVDKYEYIVSTLTARLYSTYACVACVMVTVDTGHCVCLSNASMNGSQFIFIHLWWLSLERNISVARMLLPSSIFRPRICFSTADVFFWHSNYEFEFYLNSIQVPLSSLGSMLLSVNKCTISCDACIAWK